MKASFTAKANIIINTSLANVWKVLTVKEFISEYLFGAVVETTWQVDEPIFFRGEFQGQGYEDKGTILVFEEQEQLQYSYWTSFSNLPDKPENYTIVTYILTSANESQVMLTVTQDHIPDAAQCRYAQDNWQMVLEHIKAIAEL